MKFYTGEGNYDLVGLNFVNAPTLLLVSHFLTHTVQPVFFCRDPIQGPDVIRSQSRNPQNFLLDHNSLFDLLANNPEGYAETRRCLKLEADGFVETMRA